MGVGIFLLLLVVITIIIKRKNKTPTDYYTLFIMGLIWLPCGTSIGNYAVSLVGFMFMLIGLLHRKEWNKNKKEWRELDSGQRKLVIFLITLILLVLISGLVYYFIIR